MSDTINGMPIFVSHVIPKDHIADEIIPIPWVIHWFKGVPAQWHPPSFRRGRPIERDRAFFVGGKVFMSPAMYLELKASRQ